MPSNPLLENNVQELLYVEVPIEYSAGSGIDITDNVISLDPNVSAAIDNKLDTSSFSSYSATIDDELQYVSANAGKTYSGIAPIVVNNDTNEISADTLQLSAGDNITLTEEGNIVRIDGQAGGLTGDYISGSNVTGFSLQNNLEEQGYSIHFTTDVHAGMYLSEYDSASSNQLYLDPEKLMFVENYGTPDQKNETFDANDISALKNTSGYWNEVSAVSSTSSVLNNQITAVRNDLNTISTNTGYLYNDLQTTSGILSAAIDDISSNMPEGFTGASVNTPITGDGTTATPLGLASSFQLVDNSIYTTATYGASVNVEGIMPRVQLKTNNSSYNTLGEGGMTVTHPASSVGGGYTTSHYGEKMSLSYNDGDYYLHTVDTTKSGVGVTYKGAPNVKAYYNYSGVALTNDNGATNEYVDVDAIRKWNSVYNDVSTASGGWGGGTSLTGDAQGAVDEVYANSALWSEITGVSSNYPSQTDLEQVSGDLKSDIDYVSANAITGLDGYATTSEVNTVSSYLSGQIDNKLDSTSFNPNDYYPMVGNPSGFISGVDLSDYQTKAGMTAYQPAGDYATTGDLYNTSSILSGAIDYISGNAGTTYTGVAPIVVTGNTISADSFDLNIGSGLAFENDTLYVSAESVPEGVMVESACEYNAVNEISGYNGSAIAQYGAEKQWLVHDDTLVHAANSAQYALGVNLSAVAQLLGIDETVLWSGNAPVSNCTLTEPITNFNSVKFLLYGREDANRTRMWFDCETTNDTWNIQYADGTNYAYTQLVQLSSTNTTLSAIRYKELNYGAYNSTAVSITGATGTYPAIIKAVIGIGRKQ